MIKLMSLAVHAEEFIETGEPLDAMTIVSILGDPEVVELRKSLDEMALLPVKRNTPTSESQNNYETDEEGFEIGGQG